MADIAPEYWTIMDGKLYLNLNEEVQGKWLKEMADHIKKADKNWPGVLQK